MLAVAIRFPGNTDYLAYAFCAYPIAVMIANKKIRKLKPKTITNNRD